MTNIVKLIDGNEDEWESFFADFTPIIKASVYHYCFDKSQIFDITQNVYLKLTKNEYKILKTYDAKKASLSTWISIIAKREAIDFLRNDKTHLHEEFNNNTLDFKNKSHITDANRIEIPLDILTSREKLILHLSYKKEFSQEQIAKILNIKVQSLRNSKHKALEKLRKNLK